jgi:uncharacterized protein YkwD
VIRQTPRNPTAPLAKWALALLAATGLLLTLLAASASAAITDSQANSRSLVRVATDLKKDRRLRRSHHQHSAGLGASTGLPQPKPKLAAIAQRSDSLIDGEGCEGEGLTPEPGNLEEVRTATFCLVNRQRLIHGEQPLLLNSKLQRSAQNHTISMVAEDYFSHYDPDGETPAERMKASGYIYSSEIGYEIGENIAWGTLSLATPKAIVQAWMESPGHRENILDSAYREAAIGVLPEVPAAFAEGQSGAIYTQDFGVIITN